MTNIEAYTLAQFTGIFINLARDAARHGKKDIARNWARFFKNSGIIRILENHAGNESQNARSVPPLDVLQLKNDLWKLDDECHPHTRADNTSDFSILKVQVDALAFGMAQIIDRLDNKPRRRK